MTVSRALNGEGSVSKETKERIARAVHELGYVLDLSASALSSKKTGFVAVVIPSINNSDFSETVHGISEVLETEGKQILLGKTNYSQIREERLIRVMLQRRPEGIILAGGVHAPRARQLLQRAAIPVIETWDRPQTPINHVVGFSNAATIEDLVARLLFRGYRKIAFAGGDEGSDVGSDFRGIDRRRGYENAIKTLGLPGPHHIPLGLPPISIAQGGPAMLRLVEEWPEVEAVICVSDLPAFGMISECHRRNHAVPDRLAVAGFGDFELARFSWPAITTVSVNCMEIGRQAGELMLQAIDDARGDNPLSPQTIIIPHSIIEREST